MKKSEKIEIRVSLDEKEALTQLAESEGRSVSELVRNLAKKYAQLNRPRPRPVMSRWHMAGLICCGIGIGSGLAFSLGDNLGKDKVTQYMVHGVVDGNGFGFSVKGEIDQSESITLNEGPDAFKIDVQVISGDGDSPVAAIKICKQGKDECVNTAQADLNMSLGNSPSVWQTDTKTGENLFLVLQPVSG